MYRVPLTKVKGTHNRFLKQHIELFRKYNSIQNTSGLPTSIITAWQLFGSLNEIVLVPVAIKCVQTLKNPKFLFLAWE